MPATRKRKSPDLWFDYRGERHRVVFIEYQDGHPHSVVTEEHWNHSREPWFKPGVYEPKGTCAAYWDFDWCKRDSACYYHQSGLGGNPLSVEICRFVKPDPPPGVIWCAPGVVLTRWVSKGRTNVRIRSAATLLKMGYRLLDRPLLLRSDYGKRSRNPFVVSDEVGRTVYCKVCNDRFPDDRECEHLEWCDRCGWLVYCDTHVREDDPNGKPVIHDADDDED